GEFDDLGAFCGRRAARRRCGGQRFHGDPQFGERPELFVASGTREAPPDDPRVEHVPVRSWLHGDADPSTRTDESHGLQHAHGLPRDGTGDPEPLLNAIQGEYVPAGQLTAGDLQANGVQHGVVQDVHLSLGFHAHALSLSRRHTFTRTTEWCYLSPSKVLPLIEERPWLSPAWW